MRSTPIRPPSVPLTDGRVCLRYRRAADLDAISAASEDPEIRRWLNDPPMDATARAANMGRVAAAFQTGRSAPLVIADAATDESVGLINLPRAVRLAVDWAFSELELTELLLEIDPGNLPSLRVAGKCGFRPVLAADRNLTPAGDKPGDGKLVSGIQASEPRQ